MKPESFLMNLYLGSPSRIGLPEGEETTSDTEAAEIIRRFLEVTAAHPAREGDDRQQRHEEVLQQLKQLGFFGLTIPKAYGGLGINLRQYLKIVEKTMASGMAIGFTALAHLSIGVKGIVLFGTEEQKKKYLIPAASGELIFSYALTEPKTGSDAASIETTATPSTDGRHYILNGSKAYITNANLAGAMTVFAQLDPENPGHMGAFIVETAWDGVHVGRDVPKMGLTASSTASVRFDGVRIPRENLLGAAGDGFKIAMTILNYGRLALGAGSAGMMKQSLADMSKRARQRTQFGVPIGEFQLIQEKLIKAQVNAVVASAMTEFTASMLESDPLAKVAVESSHCKLFGTTRAWDTLYDAQQVAGGSGYLATQPYEKRLRDFRVTTIFEGTTEIHSIYPALFFLRKITKWITSEPGGRLSRMFFLLRGLLLPPRWDLHFSSGAIIRAKRYAWTQTLLLRWMLAAGLLVYGKRVTEKQLFLRSITHRSLDLFGSLALMSRIEAARKKGRDAAADLLLLDYFISAAKTARRSDGFRWVFRQARIHERFAANLGIARTEEVATQPKNDDDAPVFSSGKRRPQKA